MGTQRLEWFWPNLYVCGNTKTKIILAYPACRNPNALSIQALHICRNTTVLFIQALHVCGNANALIIQALFVCLWERFYQIKASVNIFIIKFIPN
jgi:hypothetical protein